MAHTIAKLTILKINRLSQPGMYADGGGLYLQVSGPAAKSWIFRYSRCGRSREMGLGSLTRIPLTDARTAAERCRKLLGSGLDPVAERKLDRERAAQEAAKAITFSEAAERYIAAHSGKWRNEKHLAQWRSTLATYTEPVFGKLPVQTVDTGLVLSVLEPIWAAKRETASRLRGLQQIPYAAVGKAIGEISGVPLVAGQKGIDVVVAGERDSLRSSHEKPPKVTISEWSINAIAEDSARVLTPGNCVPITPDATCVAQIFCLTQPSGWQAPAGHHHPVSRLAFVIDCKR
ncbi:MAG TPA: Arm DNA-binding domain-containing protein [Xanthobacteraceae bacterium]|nr:Arm DNA-binding domain-containing protein [Xanthobacteraceae bacterium]